MALLEWTDAMAVDVPAMDATHQEFVVLLQALEAATDGELIDRYVELLTHTDVHFAREDAWMLATGFAASNCHSLQHKMVIDVLRDGERCRVREVIGRRGGQHAEERERVTRNRGQDRPGDGARAQ